MSDQSPSYPAAEYPWNFYFNGVLMPKWGAAWRLPAHLFHPEQWNEDLGHRDIGVLMCRIDHVGVVESADPHVFLYAIQEVLRLYLGHQDDVLSHLREVAPAERNPLKLPADEMFDGVVNAALQMRKLVEQDQIAFWTSGYEPDRLRLVERIERSRLPTSDARYETPPHLLQFESTLNSALESQRRDLHRLAQSSQFRKEWRSELHRL